MKPLIKTISIILIPVFLTQGCATYRKVDINNLEYSFFTHTTNGYEINKKSIIVTVNNTYQCNSIIVKEDHIIGVQRGNNEEITIPKSIIKKIRVLDKETTRHKRLSFLYFSASLILVGGILWLIINYGSPNIY